MKKIFVIIISVIVILIICIKILFGELNIYPKYSIPFDNPIYQITIQGNKIEYNLDSKKRIVIIPNIMNVFLSKGWKISKSKFSFSYGEPVILDIEGYYCYTNIVREGKKVSCSEDNAILKQIDNIEFLSLQINGDSKLGYSGTTVYNGTYKKDITEFLKKDIFYSICITIKHENIESIIVFNLRLE